MAAAVVLLVLIWSVASAALTGTLRPARVAPVATGVNLRRRRPAYKRSGSPSLRGVLWTLVPFVLSWQAFGNLDNRGNRGFACANLNNGLGNANWNIAARAYGIIKLIYYAVHLVLKHPGGNACLG